MRLKKYRVASMADAITLIRRDLGPDAVILHSRDLSTQGLFGLFRKPLIEVVAATDDEQPDGRGKNAQPPSVSPDGLAPKATEQAAPNGIASTPTSGQGLEQPSAAPSPSLPASVAARAYAESADGVALDLSPSIEPPTPPLAIQSDPALLERIAHDLDDLRATIGRLAGSTDAIGPSVETDLLSRCYAVLTEQNVCPELAADVVRTVRRDLSESARSDVIAVRDAAASRLARRLSTTGPLRPYGDAPRAVFLIGPTGVGKTTTLAKLAANLAMQQHPVALVTADTYRIAAIPQLQTYADILRIPLEVVYTPAELAELVAAQPHVGVILVDTPGRSQYRDEQIDELAEFVAAAPNRTVYLTMSAGTRTDELTEIARRFGRIPIDGLLFTKLDETSRFGSIATLAADLGKPLSYFTTGQNVPSDIEIADAGRLAGRILSALAQ